MEWMPRDSNPEADALADGRTEGFDPNLRVQAEMTTLPWLVLPKLFEQGCKFHEERQLLLAQASTGNPPAENKARKAATGMWSMGDKYISPKDWRKMNKRR